MDFTKIKKFCASKDIIKKVKDNLQNRKDYLKITYLNKGLVFRIYKNSYNSTTKMTNQLKMGKRVSPKVIYKWSTNT